MEKTIYFDRQQLSAISYFFLAMLLFPQVQERAQQEIERVVGADRLPTFEDLQAIPYIKAMLFETLRWQPTIPLGLPHRSMEDDEYNGYFIPRGTDLYPVWHNSHTERLIELNSILVCRMFGEQLTKAQFTLIASSAVV